MLTYYFYTSYIENGKCELERVYLGLASRDLVNRNMDIFCQSDLRAAHAVAEID